MMIHTVTSSAFRQRIQRANPSTKATVLYLLGQTLYQAKQGNDKEAILYLAASLATLKFSYVWMAIEGLLYANKLRNRVKH